MGKSVSRPSNTIVNDWTIVGAGSPTADEVLADTDDSTYLDMANVTSVVEVHFPTPSLPAGAIVKSLAVRLRTAYVPPPSTPFRLNQVELIAGAIDKLVTNYDTNWKTPTTARVLSVSTDVVPATPTLEIVAIGGSQQADEGRIYAAYLDMTYVALPTVDTVTVVPASPITDDDTPRINWTRTLDADGGPQAMWQVRVFNAAQYGAAGFDPANAHSVAFTQASDFVGLVAGPLTSWTLEDSLPDDTYRAYVRIAQYVGDQYLFSAWAYVQFTVTILRPANPVWAQVPTADPDNGRISFIVNAGTGGATTTSDKQVQRSLDGGTTWQDIRTTLGGGLLDASGDGQLRYDYEVPNGVPAYYRARAVHEFPSGTTSTSDWVSPT
jgi:hypothetical protein